MHRRVVLLSPELGLITATAYGVRKSGAKLSALCQPFVSGRFYLYANHAKQQFKIEDIKAERFHESLNRDLSTLYAGSFFAELIVRSYAGGNEHRAMYDLLLGLLDAIEVGDDLQFLLIQGCWRFLILLGLAPDVEYCVSCGKPLENGSGTLHFTDNGLWCQQCLAQHDTARQLSVDQRRYLHHTQDLDLGKALKVKLTPERAVHLKRVLIHYIDHATDGNLKTVRSGLL
jgi:DNA repair protein RecO (recombination protein O)